MAAGGDTRPAPDSLCGWLSMQDEAERATVACYALGRDATRADVELLRLRLLPHQRVLVEPGAAALTWLALTWDGTAERCGEVAVFSKPGPRFREPSILPRLPAGLAWPKISVVTVSFNQVDYLEQCLLSVLEQNYPNLEYIVVDAGSTDGSIALLERYRNRFARLIIEPDNGQSDGLNKGFRHATGEILTWINSDDMLAPLALKRAAIAFCETGVDMVVGTCDRVLGVESRRHFLHHSVVPAGRPGPLPLASVLNWSERWEKGNYFFQPEVLFTRDIWLRAGGYLKPYLYWAMDWELWLRFAMAGATAVRLPDVLGISREHELQKTTNDEIWIWQFINILREYDMMLEQLPGHAE
jgi:GT2 family glycosyltransferase